MIHCSGCRSMYASCRQCAEQRDCLRCAAKITRVIIAHADLDTDDDDVSYCADVRVAPPRFTPLSRMEAKYWRVHGGWHWPADPPLPAHHVGRMGAANGPWSGFCTSCDYQAKLRWFISLFFIMDGINHRYMHQVCIRCARCILNRGMAIRAATLSSRITCFEVKFAEPHQVPRLKIHSLILSPTSHVFGLFPHKKD